MVVHPNGAPLLGRSLKCDQCLFRSDCVLSIRVNRLLSRWPMLTQLRSLFWILHPCITITIRRNNSIPGIRTTQSINPQTNGATCCTTGVWSSHTDLSVSSQINPLTLRMIQSQSKIYLTKVKKKFNIFGNLIILKIRQRKAVVEMVSTLKDNQIIYHSSNLLRLSIILCNLSTGKFIERLCYQLRSETFVQWKYIGCYHPFTIETTSFIIIHWRI